MKSTAKTPDAYLKSLPPERRRAVSAIRDTLRAKLPKGFSEVMSYGMLGYVVPHSLYPDGYHCDPKKPLPFMCLASQKNYISLYHMGLYEGDLLDWFKAEWPKHSEQKLDVGQCCIRFKRADQIPLKLIGELAKKLTPKKWIRIYESRDLAQSVRSEKRAKA